MAINITTSGIKSGLKTTMNAAKVASSISKMVGRNSIARMGKESTMQFPVLMSSNMNTEEAVTIARALEKQFAAWSVTMFSLRPVMDLDKFDDFSDFLKSFHNNDNIPSNFKAASNVLESATEPVEGETIFKTEEEAQPATESTDTAIVSSTWAIESATTIGYNQDAGVGSACWDITKEQLDMENLKDLYRPYERTAQILETKIGSMKTVKEAFSDDLNQAASDLDKLHNADKFTGLNGSNTNVRKDGNVTTTVRTDATKEKSYTNSVVPNQRLTALEPTLINIQVVAHGKNSTGPNQFTHNLTLGVKAMVRLVRSDLMIANIADATKNSNAIFKFIKWAKGEVHFVRDVMLGIDSAKAKASNDKYENRLLKSSLKRKKINNFTKFLNNKVMPNLTVIITTYEALQIKELTGVDLTELHNVMNVMNKYYFLSFGIYDTEAQTLQIYFDGDEDFAWASIDAMKTQTNKDVNVKDAQNILKLMGRI